ncbi:MAG: hypothetical protein JWO85_3348 [Candidatus Eremiobacteraeota bacterium]|jgi:hypothetical protein|nr:hypothetical protein [Candidatus Eremiobacteraeota bacterium]
MGADRTIAPDEDKLPCCGHSWRLHTPACRYWYPGTRLEVPQECGCDGTASPKRTPQADDPERSQAASHPVR